MSSTLKYCNTECESQCEQDKLCNQECLEYCLNENENNKSGFMSFFSGWKLYACICVALLLIGSCLYCVFKMNSSSSSYNQFPQMSYSSRMSSPYLSPMPYAPMPYAPSMPSAPMPSAPMPSAPPTDYIQYGQYGRPI